MASNDTPGFLSKVARFVRNPLTNWSDLEQAEADKENSYSKAALKEMIERKRRNDFVRRREFDQLRKLRSRGGGRLEAEAADRPSFFQSSSLPSTSNERAGTLRKIDEIEAQMSQQWLDRKSGTKGTGDGPPQQGQSPLVSGAAASSTDEAASSPTASAPGARPESASPTTSPPSQPGTYPPTEPLPMNRTPELESWQHSLHWPADADGQQDQKAASGEAAFAHDPDLEEAAIRFANGDYEGAEAALLAQIAPGAAAIDRAQTWLTLFDLYRASGQHERFDSIAVDFASRFGRSAPVWFTMSDSPGQPPVGSASARPAVLPVVRGFNWTAPDELQAKTLATLDAALATAPRPWRLNWSRIGSIDATALEPLLRMVQRWCAQPVELRFVGSARLMQLLVDSTPAGDPAVDPLRWRLRMEMLRLMGRPDEFESTALDYCITYEISPPSWTAPRCSYKEVDPDGAIAAESKAEPLALADDSGLGSLAGALHTLPGPLDAPGPPLELAGQLVGDAGEALALLEQGAAGARMLGVRCDRLARVDFSAAGSMLNWVAARHADGCQIEFSNVQRLVAVFFNIIGINEYARVTARQN